MMHPIYTPHYFPSLEYTMSGIVPSDEAKAAYERVKTGKDSWAVFEVVDEKSVECTKAVELASDKKASKFDDFEGEVYPSIVEYISENLTGKAGYIIVDILRHFADRDQAKLTVISWCPENKLKVKAKMLHGSTLNAVKQSFEGLQGKPYQAANLGDLEFKDVLSEVGLA